jgi:phosphate transport system substrate-binding protein
MVIFVTLMCRRLTAAMPWIMSVYLLATVPGYAANVTLNETGSSLLYPVFKQWISDYTRVTPSVSITASATGSGAGVAAAISGEKQIGTSDAYMSDEQTEHNRDILNIPLAISAQTVNYNIPGLNSAMVKLDGQVLAGIYAGRIKEWDDQRIAAINPGVRLPHATIIPVRRADASGDTFIFTQFLDFSMSSWEDNIGYGTSVAWPEVVGERTANGNGQMVEVLASTPYSVGYVGISFGNAIATAKLGTVRLKNQSGKFVLPTTATVTAGASELDPRTPPDERLSLVFAPGDSSYPLINYEYAIVSKRQGDQEKAAALRQFLLWAVSLEGGNAPKYLDAVGFIPLPDFIRALSENQINSIE